MTAQSPLTPTALEETEEQTLFRASVTRIVDSRYAFDDRRRLLATDRGFSEESWAAFAEQGWLAAGFSEEDGGFGGARELSIVMEGVGRGLVLEPLAPAILAGRALALAGTEAQKARWLAPILGGSLKAAFAGGERQSRHRIHDCRTRADRSGDGWMLSGRKSVVFGAPSAEILVVLARTGGERRDADGLSLFIVDRDAPGVSLIAYPTQDALRAADVMLDGVAVPDERLLAAPGAAGPIVEAIADHAAIMACAEAVGAMTRVLEMTISHLRERVQFGQPLIRNQVLQHRIVDLWIEINEARALTADAARLLDRGATGGSAMAVSAAKALTSRAARHVGQEGVQLHGAIGVTDDHAVSHHFKRLTALAMLHGDAEHHEARYADALLRGN